MCLCLSLCWTREKARHSHLCIGFICNCTASKICFFLSLNTPWYSYVTDIKWTQCIQYSQSISNIFFTVLALSSSIFDIKQSYFSLCFFILLQSGLNCPVVNWLAFFISLQSSIWWNFHPQSCKAFQWPAGLREWVGQISNSGNIGCLYSC